MNPDSTVTTRLDHIKANLVAIRQYLGNRLILAPVKANAYGHGVLEIARMIEDTKTADWLGVAAVDEALALRRAGITLPILKLSMARGDAISAAIQAQVTLTVTDELSIAETAQIASNLNRSADVHLKVDTGMHRIGCPAADAVALATHIMETPHLQLTGIMSHMPVSDTPAQNDFTAAEIQQFTALCTQVESVAGLPLIKHLANSGGVLAHPDSWFDMVRPGITVYGGYPDSATPKTIKLQPGLEWRTQVSFIAPVPQGETVSYGRTWQAPNDTLVATIPVGYADGFARALSNRGRVLINGRSYPIVGRVCMDQTMIELGPTTDVQVGDKVTLIGRDGAEEITTAEIADLIGTIPYEVTCLISNRVGRDQVPVN